MGAENSTMQSSANACSGCKNFGNKKTDTVLVDLDAIKTLDSRAAGKENSDPGQMRECAAQKKQQAEELKKSEEEAKQRAEEQRRRRQEADEQRQRQLEELRKKQAEEEAALRAKEEEAARIAEEQERLRRIEEEAKAAKQRQEEEERLRRIQEEEEEEARRRQEEEEASRRLREEEEAAKNERLRAFLEKAGFKTATEKKLKKGMTRMMPSGFSYPLHAAVEANDAEAVEVLLWAGADPSLSNSKKQTPLQLAQAKNSKQGSHAKVIAALSA